MDCKGKILSCTKNLTSEGYIITLSVPTPPENLPENVNIHITPIEKNRTKAANSMLWSLINKLAKAMHEDKWFIYRMILKKYGEFECVLVDKSNPEALSALIKEWRDYEIIGVRKEGSDEFFEVLCYYGSSKLDSQGFGALIDGIKSELDAIGVAY